jgi:hypothetical protein
MDTKTVPIRGVNRRRLLLICGGAGLCLLAGLWVILFVRPTLDTPKFLRQLEPTTKQSRYDETMKMVSRGGRMQPVPVASVTESNVFFPGESFDNTLNAAQEELTSANGWDLQGLPRSQLAVFFQRSTGSLIRIQEIKSEVRVVVYQSRYATPLDRLRNWIGMYEKALN